MTFPSMQTQHILSWQLRCASSREAKHLAPFSRASASVTWTAWLLTQIQHLAPPQFLFASSAVG
jgi:hypothetical protein